MKTLISQPSDINHSAASPNRLMTAFVAQRARLLAALNDEGGLFECRFLARLLDRQRTSLTAAKAEADTINSKMADLRRTLLRETSATDNTPGILDPLETEQFLTQVARLGHSTRHHAGHMGQQIN